jgi:hypothetical protein
MVLSLIGIPAAFIVDNLKLTKHSPQVPGNHAQCPLLSLTEHARDCLDLARWMAPQNAPQCHRCAGKSDPHWIFAP